MLEIYGLSSDSVVQSPCFSPTHDLVYCSMAMQFTLNTCTISQEQHVQPWYPQLKPIITKWNLRVYFLRSTHMDAYMHMAVFLPMPSLHLSAAMKMNLTLAQATLDLCLVRSHATTIPMVLRCLSTYWGLHPSHRSRRVDFLWVVHENPTNYGWVPFNSKPGDARWEAGVSRCSTY